MAGGSPKLVIFDCDGVLVDSEPISNTVLARTLTDAGLPTTPRGRSAGVQGKDAGRGGGARRTEARASTAGRLA